MAPEEADPRIKKNAPLLRMMGIVIRTHLFFIHLRHGHQHRINKPIFSSQNLVTNDRGLNYFPSLR
jgi:hypothetical protein